MIQGGPSAVLFDYNEKISEYLLYCDRYRTANLSQR